MKPRFLLALLPLVLLVGLIAVFATQMGRDTSLVRSVLIDKPAPTFTLPAVAGTGVEGFDTASLTGEVTVVNVFASWCVPCRAEHPMLEVLKSRADIRLVGINQKDAPENAASFLAELGNPYDVVGADANNRASIEWGVYGVPETFIVDRNGIITFKHIGPITAASLEREVLPAIEAAKKR